jgi:hypothetical protein
LHVVVSIAHLRNASEVLTPMPTECRVALRLLTVLIIAVHLALGSVHLISKSLPSLIASGPSLDLDDELDILLGQHERVLHIFVGRLDVYLITLIVSTTCIAVSHFKI